jgi:hypothetical protein
MDGGRDGSLDRCHDGWARFDRRWRRLSGRRRRPSWIAPRRAMADARDFAPGSKIVGLRHGTCCELGFGVVAGGCC